MTDWVIQTTFNIDPDEATMDAWQAVLDESGVDGSLARTPALHQAVVTVYQPVADMITATCMGYDLATEIVGRVPVGVETITEDEQQRRAAEPTMPELMSAAEIAEELDVTRQRVHQLRDTKAFPAPLAELRGGAVWDAVAVRKFAQDWDRKPGRPAKREPVFPLASKIGTDVKIKKGTRSAKTGKAVKKANVTKAPKAGKVIATA